MVNVEICWKQIVSNKVKEDNSFNIIIVSAFTLIQIIYVSNNIIKLISQCSIKKSIKTII